MTRDGFAEGAHSYTHGLALRSKHRHCDLAHHLRAFVAHFAAQNGSKAKIDRTDASP